jgi:hypothetical protein
VGTVINGGLNARIAYQTFDRAQRAYRLRFLTEKYNLDPKAWAPEVVEAEVIDIPRVDQLLEEQLGLDPDEKDPGEKDPR